jgi:putative endonuclease
LSYAVITGLVPGRLARLVVMDPRDKPGHDRRVIGEAHITVITGLVPVIHKLGRTGRHTAVVMDTRDKPGYDAREMGCFVYIVASGKHGTLYIGVTSDLPRRIWEHRESEVDGFTKKYGVNRLVYFESHDDPRSAIQREKSLKKWPRDWKINLIERENPDWVDLFPTLSM